MLPAGARIEGPVGPRNSSYVKIGGWGGKFTLVPVKPYVKGKSMYIMWAFNVEKF